MFGRARRPRPRRLAARIAARSFFAEADALAARGDPASAAEAFNRAAEQMQSMGRPRQAANLFARSAHVWLDAGNTQSALTAAMTAMELFSARGLLRRAAEFQMNFSSRLKQSGDLQAVQTFTQAFVPVQAAQAAAAPAAAARRLPSACPQCGAPVHPDEVEWMDEVSASCDFCGATLHCLA